MALDVGDARIGIAVSDPLGVLAQPHSVVNAEPVDDAVRSIAALVRELAVQYVVTGLPLNQRGEEGPQAEKVRAFNAKLQAALDVDVITQDERFTTAEAERVLLDADLSREKRKQVIDQQAAALILQAWLDAHRPRD